MKPITLLIAILCTLYIAPLSLSAQVSYTSDTTSYVKVTFNGSSAAIVVSNDIKDYITASVNGADVTVTSTATSAINEVSYGLYGTTTDGSFTFNGTYKATVELFGVSITNPTGPAINLQNGKRIEISAKSGTTSTLKDGTSTAVDAWKGALYCKGHIQFKGYGTLNVYGNYAHAIKAGEYIEMKNCTINVYSAVKDAVNCNQYFLMESGVLNLSGYGDDGIQVDLKTDDASVENTGNFTMTGGTININTYGSTGEAVKIAGTQSVAATASLNVSETQGIGNVQGDNVQCTKVLRGGVFLIERNGKIYSITGKEIQQ
ncbi:MAG: carbohydrate-binding domain-containing protein [Paludibacteraceae bacterium]|nr:carbohydrate-binding domain-containing protein [Paludibacteraceae bacterium]